MFLIQLILVLAIILFPETVQESRYTDYEELVRPVSAVNEPGRQPNEIRRKIAEFGIFSRVKNTRGLSVDTPRKAVVIIGNPRLEDSVHFDRLMVYLYEKGIGSLYIDPVDTPLFVPLGPEEGVYYTSSERQAIFYEELTGYLRDLGYGEMSLWIFSQKLDETLSRFAAENNAFGSLVLFDPLEYEAADKGNLPPVLIVTDRGRQNPGVEDQISYRQFENRQTLWKFLSSWHGERELYIKVLDWMKPYFS